MMRTDVFLNRRDGVSLQANTASLGSGSFRHGLESSLPLLESGVVSGGREFVCYGQYFSGPHILLNR